MLGREGETPPHVLQAVGLPLATMPDSSTGPTPPSLLAPEQQTATAVVEMLGEGKRTAHGSADDAIPGCSRPFARQPT